jgi:hypothetical protein
MNKFGHWILISGSGIGAGKTYLSRKFAGLPRVSLAQALRDDLYSLHPEIDWNNRSQEYKNSSPPSLGGITVRQRMIDWGQQRCDNEPAYWPRRLMEQLTNTTYPHATFVVDDLRKVVELDYFRGHGKSVLHFHVYHDGAVREPQYDGDQLLELADYAIMRRD